jgi:hypothetical protein
LLVHTPPEWQPEIPPMADVMRTDETWSYFINWRLSRDGETNKTWREAGDTWSFSRVPALVSRHCQKNKCRGVRLLESPRWIPQTGAWTAGVFPQVWRLEGVLQGRPDAVPHEFLLSGLEKPNSPARLLSWSHVAGGGEALGSLLIIRPRIPWWGSQTEHLI